MSISIMERFCLSVDDEDMRDDLCDAIRGRGAFRYVSKTGFMHTGLLKSGTGIVMQPCERLPWRGVRHMVFRIQRHKEHTDGGSRQ